MTSAILHARICWATACLSRALDRPASESDLVEARGRIHETESHTAAPFELLRARLALTEVQFEALWFLACCEIEPALVRLARVLGAWELDVTVAVLLQVLEASGLGHLADRQLDRLAALGLVETIRDPRVSYHRRTIRASDRVVELARGQVELDHELAGIATLAVHEELAPGLDPADELRVALTCNSIVVAVGPEGSGRKTLLERAAAGSGLQTLRVRCSALSSDCAQLERQARIIARECQLLQLVPLLANVDAAPGAPGGNDSLEILRDGLSELGSPILVTTTLDHDWRLSRPVLIRRMSLPNAEQRESVWRAALPDCDPRTVAAAANRYFIYPGAILGAARNARLRKPGNAACLADLHEGLSSHVAQQLGTIAARIVCTQSWNDLVLPVEQFDQLIELVSRVRYRRKVFEDWGFGKKIGRGLGLATLLSGPPGTGKTMVAGLVANELGLDLYQVDLSKTVSKYIGETEKNLSRVFDAAETGHAVLLFDEAESLFAKRSEVRSSNDRYANLEVNYLLQRIEQFSGISLLTTNHENAIDDAFRRRLALHIRLPLPEAEQRELLWRAVLPDESPVSTEVDFTALARFEMSGGYIKNAVVRAAFLAADQQSALTMEHLRHAARLEYESMGKVHFSLEP